MNLKRSVDNKNTRLFLVKEAFSPRVLLYWCGLSYVDPLEGRAQLVMPYPNGIWLMNLAPGYTVHVVDQECARLDDPTYALDDIVIFLNNCRLLETKIPHPVALYSENWENLTLTLTVACDIVTRKGDYGPQA